jgi:hypothetical protein
LEVIQRRLVFFPTLSANSARLTNYVVIIRHFAGSAKMEIIDRWQSFPLRMALGGMPQ